VTEPTFATPRHGRAPVPDLIGMTRASTPLAIPRKKTWMAGTNLDEPGHDAVLFQVPSLGSPVPPSLVIEALARARSSAG
jgi:hypothetical protein